MIVERSTIIEKTKVKVKESRPSSMVVITINGKEVLALNQEKPKLENEKQTS